MVFSPNNLPHILPFIYACLVVLTVASDAAWVVDDGAAMFQYIYIHVCVCLGI